MGLTISEVSVHGGLIPLLWVHAEAAHHSGRAMKESSSACDRQEAKREKEGEKGPQER